MSDMDRRDVIRMMATAMFSSASSNADASNNENEYWVLACDGGGIRGYLTALVLQSLEAEQPFLSRVNLFAGTSTGAIIALGLASGKTAKQAADLFAQQGQTIFGGAPLPRANNPVNKLYDFFKTEESKLVSHLGFSPGELLHPKYQNYGLKQVLEKVLGANKTFGNLGRSALVTTFMLSSDSGWAPLVLHNLGARQKQAKKTRLQDQATLDVKLVDAAMASSAAPLYFPPYELPNYGYCVDGGLFANCPAAIAYALATAFVPDQKRRKFRLLSIGTGAPTDSMIVPTPPFSHPGEYGAAAWLSPVPLLKQSDGSYKTPAFPLISALFDASSASHNYICQANPGMDYQRIQFTLTSPLPLDDASPDAMNAIKDVANSWIAGPEFKKTIQWLKGRVTNVA